MTLIGIAPSTYEVATATIYHVPDRDVWSGLQQQRYTVDATAEETEVQLQRTDDIIGKIPNIGFFSRSTWRVQRCRFCAALREC